VFLKSNRSIQNNDKHLISNDGKTTQKLNLSSMVDHPKGILRDRNFGEPIVKNSFVEKNEGKSIDLEEDKKSVRYT